MAATVAGMVAGLALLVTVITVDLVPSSIVSRCREIKK
jgi:hypothetical protein